MGEICVVYKRASTNDTPVSSLSEHFLAFEIWNLGAVNVFSAMFLTVPMAQRRFLENMIIDSAKFCQQLHCTLIIFHIVINKRDEWWWFIACDFRTHIHTHTYAYAYTIERIILHRWHLHIEPVCQSHPESVDHHHQWEIWSKQAFRTNGEECVSISNNWNVLCFVIWWDKIHSFMRATITPISMMMMMMKHRQHDEQEYQNETKHQARQQQHWGNMMKSKLAVQLSQLSDQNAIFNLVTFNIKIEVTEQLPCTHSACVQNHACQHHLQHIVSYSLVLFLSYIHLRSFVSDAEALWLWVCVCVCAFCSISHSFFHSFFLSIFLHISNCYGALS